MDIMINNETNTTHEPVTALESIAAEFDTIDWKYTQTAKKLEFRFPAKPFTGWCVARIHGENFLLVGVTLGLFVPEQARPTVLSLMNRHNWDLLMGNLEMDEEDGEVRLRYTYPLIAGRLDGERAVGTIMQLCSLAKDLAPELLQASATIANLTSSSDQTAITLQ